jgi:hypothetical protein
MESNQQESMLECCHNPWPHEERQVLGDINIAVRDLNAQSVSVVKIPSAAGNTSMMDRIVELGETMPPKGAPIVANSWVVDGFNFFFLPSSRG